MKLRIICITLLAAASTSAWAAPGLGEKVYGAQLQGGVSEIETRYGRLTGGQADGEDGLVIELSHAFSDRLEAALLVETERAPHGGREVSSYAFEMIGVLGHVDAFDLDVAVYGEYGAVRHGTNTVEAKLLLEHRKGRFDSRFNLVAERELRHGAPAELRYAASADWQAIGEFRLGAEAFGSLGSTHDFLPREEHFAGPMIRTEIEHLPGKGELEIETGYLFAIGKARDDSKGQFRLVLEYEFHL